MRAIFEQTVQFWQNYWGSSIFPWLLGIVVLYLLVWKRKNRYTKYILGYLAVALFIFFCPVTAKIIQKCIGELVYWRVLWILPSAPVLAYGMTEFLKDRKGLLQFVCVLLCGGMIILCGKEFYREGYYKKVHNYQQVPDEVAGICELVKADAGEEEICLAADNYISPYVRVYDPSITMVFGREGRGNGKKRSVHLYQEINSPAIDYGNLGRYGNKINCGYLVASVASEEQKSQLKKWGYTEIGTVGNYGVYKLKK